MVQRAREKSGHKRRPSNPNTIGKQLDFDAVTEAWCVQQFYVNGTGLSEVARACQLSVLEAERIISTPIVDGGVVTRAEQQRIAETKPAKCEGSWVKATIKVEADTEELQQLNRGHGLGRCTTCEGIVPLTQAGFLSTHFTASHEQVRDETEDPDELNDGFEDETEEEQDEPVSLFEILEDE